MYWQANQNRNIAFPAFHTVFLLLTQPESRTKDKRQRSSLGGNVLIFLRRSNLDLRPRSVPPERTHYITGSKI